MHFINENFRSCALLLVLITSLMLCMAVLVYKHGGEPKYSHFEDKFFQVFTDSKLPDYESVIQKLDSADKVVLMGRQVDAVGEFVKYYLKRKIGKFDIKWRNLTHGQFEYHTDSLLLGMGFEIIDEHILQHKHRPIQQEWRGDSFCVTGDLRYLWVLDNGNRSLAEIDKQKLEELMVEYPDDKFLIISSPTHHKIRGFKNVLYDRPSQRDIETALWNVGITDQLEMFNIFHYFEDNLDLISNLLNQPNPAKSFAQIFDQEENILKILINDSPKSVEKLLDELCLKGFAKRDRPLKALGPSNRIVGYHDGSYYWTEYDFIYAYSHMKRFLCKDTFELAPVMTDGGYLPEPIPRVQEDQSQPINQKKQQNSKRKLPKKEQEAKPVDSKNNDQNQDNNNNSNKNKPSKAEPPKSSGKDKAAHTAAKQNQVKKPESARKPQSRKTRSPSEL